MSVLNHHLSLSSSKLAQCFPVMRFSISKHEKKRLIHLGLIAIVISRRAVKYFDLITYQESSRQTSRKR